jgi:iron complex outermembrane receptor protein
MPSLKSVFLFCILFISVNFIHSQNLGFIQGIVRDSMQTPMDGAVVNLLKSADSSLVKSYLTETNGEYSFPLLIHGVYFLDISYIGYQNYVSSPIQIDTEHSNLILADIILVNGGSTQLKTLEIVAKKPFVERKVDRVVVNPDALITNAGTTAMDVLEKSPGLQVDLDGNIRMNGRPGVLIYIDDRPTYMTPADLAAYLRSLPSSALGTIEIMSNPPAKYEAAGNVGIINIKMKKTKAEGFNGSVNASYGQGFYMRSNNSANFNYRINKLNFFSSVGYNKNGSYQDLNINRKYFNLSGDLQSIFDQNTYIKRNSENLNARLGLDYYATSKTTLGLVLTGFRLNSRETSTNIAEITDSLNVLTSEVHAFNPTDRIFSNGNININLNHKLDSLGQEISFNADYVLYDSQLDQSLRSWNYSPEGEFLSGTNLISDLPSDVEIMAAQLDYMRPLGKAGRLDGGARTSSVSTHNVADFFDEEGGVLTVNNDFSNNFEYDEVIQAAYLNYSVEGTKFSVQTGLRYENTDIEGRQIGNELRPDSIFTRKYDGLFPTFYLTYKIDSAAQHVLGFSYGRRVERPNYQDLNPFTYPLDRFTLYAGNPFLRPTFSHNLEATYTAFNMITLTGLYSRTEDVINETIEQSEGIFYSRPGNFGKATTYGVSLTGGVPLSKWCTLQFYTEVMHNKYEAVLYDQKIDNEGTYWYFGPTAQFQITPMWAAELGGSYQTAIAMAQFVVIPVGSIRAGVSKKIMKNMGSLRLNVNDVFFTNQPGGDIKGLENSTASWLSYIDTRVVTLSFSYRFNKGQTLSARKTGSSESETQRVR